VEAHVAFGKSPVNFLDITGQRFGHLTVVGRGGSTQKGQARWECRCDCGQTFITNGQHLRSGHTQSCGCIKGKANRTHGMKGTPTHNSWCAMKQRCHYPRHQQFRHYGGRGISVCERWMRFENFLTDMGERPAGMTIDRINSDGNYEPGNCRWAPEAEQARNRRSTINVTRDGVTKCIRDWCDELGLDVDRVYGRIRRGAIPEEALR
jgi:hypothetical protein